MSKQTVLHSQKGTQDCEEKKLKKPDCVADFWPYAISFQQTSLQTMYPATSINPPLPSNPPLRSDIGPGYVLSLSLTPSLSPLPSLPQVKNIP